MSDKSSEHDWHLFDAERGLEVRRTANRFRRYQWEVRDRDGRVVALDDAEFDRLRSTDWLPGALR